MKPSTVNINVFSPRSIERGIEKIERFIEALEKWDELVERIAKIGFEVARSGFDFAVASSIDDDPVDVQLVKINDGFQIQANGRSVCYLEFGAGVYYNGMGSYPVPLPPGIDGIGEHDTIADSGVSKGIYQAWGYYNKSGELVITRGNPSAQAMYQAKVEMEKQAEQIIREVFER